MVSLFAKPGTQYTINNLLAITKFDLADVGNTRGDRIANNRNINAYAARRAELRRSDATSSFAFTGFAI